MRIAIDIDSTLHHYWDQFAAAAKRRFGVELPYERQLTWGVDRLRPEQLRACVIETHSDENVLAAVPYDGAVETVRRWHAAGHFILITSHRAVECNAATTRWLSDIALPYDLLHCSYDKISHCVEHNVDLLVDDSPVNLVNALDAGMAVATIRHPWNADVCESEPVICADDWPALERALEPLLSGHTAPVDERAGDRPPRPSPGAPRAERNGARGGSAVASRVASRRAATTSDAPPPTIDASVRARYVLIVTGLLVLLAGVASVLVYDATRADRIAAGVTVNGIDVGGLHAGAARVKLRERLIEPLQRPMVVRHPDRRFRLTADQARLRVDVESSVQEALDASRAGDPFSRTWRSLRNKRIDHDVEARVSYSRASVRKLVARVGETLDRDAVDADIHIDARGVDVRRAKAGRRVNARRLERQLHRRLIDFDGRRTVAAQTVTIEPRVTDEELEKRYPAVLIVDRSSFTLTLYKRLKEAKRYQVAVGKVGMETPEGLYEIQNKAVNPAWHVPDSDWAGDLAGKVIAGDDPKNPIKARWMGIYDGAGIHGTDADESIGSAASHGCIRMRIPEVIELYEDVPVSAPVYIA